MNEVTLVGHLCADPVVQMTSTGKQKATLRLATNRTWKATDGSKKSSATFHRVVCWGPQAESCGKYLKKGRQVMVKGRIDNRTYQDTEGKTRYISEVVAGRVDFLSSGKPVALDTPVKNHRISAEEAFPL